MQREYVLITEDNREAFASVLPEEVYGGSESVAIGATLGFGSGVAGAVVLTHGETEYRIDWLYVAEPFRRMGVGTELITEVNRFVEETGFMPVECMFPVEDEENDDLLSFFNADRGDNVIIETRLSHVRFLTEAKDFYSSRDIRGAVTKGNKIFCLFNQGEIYKRRALQLIADKLYITDQRDFENRCVPELCLTTSAGDMPTSVLLTQNTGGYLWLSYLFGKNPRDLYQILCTAAAEVKVNYPDKHIVFDVVSPSAMALSERFFGNAKRFNVYEAEW